MSISRPFPNGPASAGSWLSRKKFCIYQPYRRTVALNHFRVFLHGGCCNPWFVHQSSVCEGNFHFSLHQTAEKSREITREARRLGSRLDYPRPSSFFKHLPRVLCRLHCFMQTRANVYKMFCKQWQFILLLLPACEVTVRSVQGATQPRTLVAFFPSPPP